MAYRKTSTLTVTSKPGQCTSPLAILPKLFAVNHPSRAPFSLPTSLLLSLNVSHPRMCKDMHIVSSTTAWPIFSSHSFNQVTTVSRWHVQTTTYVLSSLSWHLTLLTTLNNALLQQTRRMLVPSVKLHLINVVNHWQPSHIHQQRSFKHYALAQVLLGNWFSWYKIHVLGSFEKNYAIYLLFDKILHLKYWGWSRIK